MGSSDRPTEQPLAATETYRKLEKIGAGTYGKVYKAAQTDANGREVKLVALKKIKINHREEGIPSTAMREVALLKELSHTNIVSLLDVIYDSPNLYLVFEYAVCDLRKFIDKQTDRRLSSAQTKAFMRQILSGIAYCHQHCVLHRDLKPQNILVDSKGNIKVADFGLSRPFGIPVKALTHEVVTLWYRAPEILLGLKEYFTAVDIWSAGCILAEMAAGRPLFPGDSEIDEIMRIFRILGTPNERIWPGVTALPYFKELFPVWRPREPLCTYLSDAGNDLAQQLMTYDPSKRITAKKALIHDFFVQKFEYGA